MKKFKITYGNKAWEDEIIIYAKSNIEAKKIVNSELRNYIKINEFNYIMDYISQNNLKRGYELATAFGISAVAKVS